MDQPDLPAVELAVLNEADPAGFAASLRGIFEHAPWVEEQAAALRPFATVSALHEAMMGVVQQAGKPEMLAFLNGHPELAAGQPVGGLTPESHAEQAGLRMAGTAGADELPALEHAYRERFGFPFIVCVARQTAANVMRVIRRRSDGTPEAELAAALQEVRHITRLRLVQRVTGPGMPKTSGSLSLHVLDMAAGCPGAGMAITLLQEGKVVASGTTDHDGRMGKGLLPPGPLRQGEYELQFAAGAYFAERGASSLYGTIPIRFVIAEAESHYHIPLLAAPYGYSTYRGS